MLLSNCGSSEQETLSSSSTRGQETSRGREVSIHRQDSAGADGLGGGWTVSVLFGAVSPTHFNQSCISSLALRLQLEGCAGKSPLSGSAHDDCEGPCCQLLFGQGRISPCSRTLNKGRKWPPGLPKQLLGLYDSSREYVIAILACLIWPLLDLPCGLRIPGRKSSCCAARWFWIFCGAPEKQVLMVTNELSLVPS